MQKICFWIGILFILLGIIVFAVFIILSLSNKVVELSTFNIALYWISASFLSIGVSFLIIWLNCRKKINFPMKGDKK